MSNYRNYIQDFPTRGLDILINFDEKAQLIDREITLLLSILSTSLTFVQERLAKPSDSIEHPSGNRKSARYQSAVGKYSNMLGKSFLGNELWEVDPKTWRFKANAVNKSTSNDHKQWAVGASPLSTVITGKHVISHLRNAFAHASVFSLSSKVDPAQIGEFIFLSRNMSSGTFHGQYHLIAVSTPDLFQFSIKWMEFLKSLEVPA